MATFDSRQLDAPMSGPDRDEFTSRMALERKKRNVIRNHLAALRREGKKNAPETFKLLDLAKREGLRVVGTDNVPRMRQKGLQDMAMDRQALIGDVIAKKQITQDVPVRQPRRRFDPQVIPTQSTEDKEALQQDYQDFDNQVYGGIVENEFNII